ncbi:glutathione peroxidase [Tenacibaculum sp. IB213877]|uniref:glutathione peroxidase n=1 Tax=Tenacibaculum sp. IB213877 TaxID=3097351 RepID=UPI002A5AEF30|nr:glutathione peroxidase [Tenacibaculum sp. IB213877]MDY0781419.1 glutathione peroxidase [Tenacibaculum sp. IB213877]
MKTLYVLPFLILSLYSCKSQTNKNTTNMSVYNVKINTLQGKEINFSDYQGKKILFVNVASKCGFTPQYEGLQKLSDEYSEKLVVIGVPCNQFGGQEPGTSSEIQEFCQVNYGVTFPITEKVDVKGDNQHPLYKFLTDKDLNGNKNSSVKWNFQKYLVDENGNLIDYWYSITKPQSKKITKYLQ